MLDQIVKSVKRSIEDRNRTEWERQVNERLDRCGDSFRLSSSLRPGGFGFIFEIKRKSPSSNGIAIECDVSEIARTYETLGASAISVLTEYNYFGGSLADLAAVRKAVSLPLLRKEFIVDKLQVGEAKIHGAGAVLLITAILDDIKLREFIGYAESIGLDSLVEVHDGDELARAVGAGARIIGVNNRNLQTMAINLETSERLLPAIPKGVLRVAESGITNRHDVTRMREAGADAVLVGTSVIRSADMTAKIKELTTV